MERRELIISTIINFLNTDRAKAAERNNGLWLCEIIDFLGEHGATREEAADALVAGNREGIWQLSRQDIVVDYTTKDPNPKVAASEIRHLNAQFHYMRF